MVEFTVEKAGAVSHVWKGVYDKCLGFFLVEVPRVVPIVFAPYLVNALCNYCFNLTKLSQKRALVTLSILKKLLNMQEKFIEAMLGSEKGIQAELIGNAENRLACLL